jgi:hypothetical protein
MKKIEISKFGLGSVFKVMMYLMVLPIAFCFVIGVVMAIIGAVTKAYHLLAMGVFFGIGYPVIFILVYGLFGTLMALIYNGLAGKFGGLELTIREIEEGTGIEAKTEEMQ